MTEIATHDPNLFNDDLAPVSPYRRTWTWWNIAALWIGMAICIPTYTLASSLVDSGWTWQAAVGAVILGNVVVLIPIALNSHAGTRYGIPFPVLARASFGVLGANIPALLRGLVACGWFGIQTWIGGWAIYKLLEVLWPGIATLPHFLPAFVGLGTGEFLCFMLFWGLNVWIVLRGKLQWIMEGIDTPLIAQEGDIVYAPPKTFHIPEFLGDGPACRLTSSTYPSANHIFDAPPK